MRFVWGGRGGGRERLSSEKREKRERAKEKEREKDKEGARERGRERERKRERGKKRKGKKCVFTENEDCTCVGAYVRDLRVIIRRSRLYVCGCMCEEFVCDYKR